MQVNGAKNNGNSSMSPTSPSLSSPSPWLVLYCGANPKVEEEVGEWRRNGRAKRCRFERLLG